MTCYDIAVIGSSAEQNCGTTRNKMRFLDSFIHSSIQVKINGTVYKKQIVKESVSLILPG